MYNNHNIIAINFSDANFETQRKYNTLTAYKTGKADKVIEYTPKDIDKEFYHKNSRIFAYRRGAGLWLWKPYFILKTLVQIKEGDYLFYCDSGAFYDNKISRLIDVLEKEDISVMPFELPLLERQWTKKEVFSIMGHNDLSSNQICASYILLKKNDFSRKIIEEWLNYMQDERCASPNQFTQEKNPVDFIEHREDQSVFSLTCRKNGIIPFRDPSQFGDRPWQYAWNKKYADKKQWTYNEKKYPNSPYPRIIVSNRRVEPQAFRKREKIRNLLWHLGIYNKYYFKYKTGAII